jgi:hypothetical protein
MTMRMFKRSSMNLPVALSVKPSGNFDPGDGNWSTFNLAVGGGIPQNFRVVISTSSLDIWLPTPQGTVCQNASPSSCASMRGVGYYGGLQSTGYEGNRSNSALSGGSLGIETLDIGTLDANTLFGKDYGSIQGELWADYLTITTATNPSTSHNSSSPVPIYGFASNNYYLASFGVGYGALTTTAGIEVNSSLSAMATTGTIPSVSWGYTAGAYYGQYVPFPSIFCGCRNVGKL